MVPFRGEGPRIGAGVLGVVAAWGRRVRLHSGHGFHWPELGRFISQDPIGDGVNWYAYAGNNPVVWVDPEGLAAETVVDAALAVWDVGTAIKCPTWQNIGYASVSVVALALPFVPNAVGYVRHGAEVGRALRHSDDAAALVNLAKQAKRTGVTPEEARILTGWADELGVYSRVDPPHPGRATDFRHLKIGAGRDTNHIRITDR